MDRRSIMKRLCINTRDDSSLAREHGLGIEVVDYLTAQTSDDLTQTMAIVDEKLRGIKRRILHGPVPEHGPAADATHDCRLAFSTLAGALPLARHHGIDKIVFHSGYPAGAFHARQWLADSAGFWREFLLGAPSDLSICIENVSEESPEPLAQLIDAIGNARVTACLDIGHARVHSSRPIAEWIDALGPRIGHVHLHNNDGCADKHWSLGHGVIDMAATLDLLRQRAAGATLTLECDAVASLTWLAEYCAGDVLDPVPG